MKMCVTKKVQAPELELKTIAEKEIVFEKSDRVYTEDLLAIFTIYTKVVLYALGDLYRGFQNSAYYKIIFHTTQPAHLVTILSVSAVAFLFLPSGKQNQQLSPLLTLIYLGSFSAHFGAQIWMTFVSGLSLYFSLPRHTFGSVQQVLFPKYFFLNAGLSLVTLAIFIRHNKSDLGTPQISIQVGAMTLCFFIELIIRVYLAPGLLELMVQKNNMEKEAGVGLEVGKHNPGDLIRCPFYLKIHRNFRRVHMIIAVGNIVAMASTILHLHYLSQKLCAL